MKVRVAVAQIPVTWDLSENLKAITAALADTEPGEVVVLPEAAVSGYAMICLAWATSTPGPSQALANTWPSWRATGAST